MAPQASPSAPSIRPTGATCLQASVTGHDTGLPQAQSIVGSWRMRRSGGPLELAFDRFHQRFRLRSHAGPKPPHDSAVPGDQKFFEVPLDRSWVFGVRRGQEIVQIALIPAVDVDLLEHIKGDAV